MMIRPGASARPSTGRLWAGTDWGARRHGARPRRSSALPAMPNQWMIGPCTCLGAGGFTELR
eukprot:7735357-Pyramimonas_sp.AAC.1